MVIAGVVEYEEHATAAALMAQQSLEEGLECLGVEDGAHHAYELTVLRLTAPKHATDLRVGACCRMGSLISGAIHIRQREPCCWKWHSSRLQSSMSARRARRRSFFTAATFSGSA